MTEKFLFFILLWGWMGVAGIIFIFLFFMTAPYGRYHRSGWGPALDSRLGWILMEVPAALGFGIWYFSGKHSATPTAIIFFCMWEAHYLYRTFVYPFRLRGSRKMIPGLVAGMAFFFNLINSYLNGRHISHFSGGYTTQWIIDPRFIIGVILFLAGFLINHHSDGILRKLRKPGGTEYRIPREGLFRWVSCPNYFGEILEWTGWAIATWSLTGLAFALWTIANLVPRARYHHQWYHQHFNDYPEKRKILIPGLW